MHQVRPRPAAGWQHLQGCMLCSRCWHSAPAQVVPTAADLISDAITPRLLSLLLSPLYMPGPRCAAPTTLATWAPPRPCPTLLHLMPVPALPSCISWQARGVPHLQLWRPGLLQRAVPPPLPEAHCAQQGGRGLGWAGPQLPGGRKVGGQLACGCLLQRLSERSCRAGLLCSIRQAG